MQRGAALSVAQPLADVLRDACRARDSAIPRRPAERASAAARESARRDDPSAYAFVAAIDFRSFERQRASLQDKNIANSGQPG